MPIPAYVIPAAISAASALYGAFKKPPSVPKYQPSAWEREYYRRLQEILEGKSPLFTQADIERQYRMRKERMLPEYERVRKEAGVRFARRGIEGGPVTGFETRLGERQLQDLMRMRQMIEEETRRLEEQRKMAALQGLGGLGRARSAEESRRAMAGFETQMRRYQALQEALADLMGVSGSYAYEQAFPQQTYIPTTYYPTGFRPEYYSPHRYTPRIGVTSRRRY